MKTLIIYVCILIFASFSSATVNQELKSAVKVESATHDCMKECNMSADDWFTEDDIINNRYAESENKEKSRKNGCVIECRLQKYGAMQGRELIEANMLAIVDEEFEDLEMRIIVHEILRECMREVKDSTEVYETGLSLYICALKAIHEIAAEHENNNAEDY